MKCWQFLDLVCWVVYEGSEEGNLWKHLKQIQKCPLNFFKYLTDLTQTMKVWGLLGGLGWRTCFCGDNLTIASQLSFPQNVQSTITSFFFLHCIMKNKFMPLSPHTQEKTFGSYYKNNYLLGFGLRTSFLFLNQYTESKHALSLLNKKTICSITDPRPQWKI